MIPYLEKLVEDRMSELGIPEQMHFVDQNWKRFSKGQLILYVKDVEGRGDLFNHFYRNKTVFFVFFDSGDKWLDDSVPF